MYLYFISYELLILVTCISFFLPFLINSAVQLGFKFPKVDQNGLCIKVSQEM